MSDLPGETRTTLDTLNAHSSRAIAVGVLTQEQLDELRSELQKVPVLARKVADWERFQEGERRFFEALEEERSAYRRQWLDALRDVQYLHEALRFQDPRNAAARYDKIADDFYRETGLWPPGRSRPAAMGPDPEAERAASEWRVYCNAWHERWFDAVLGAK